MTYRDLIDGLIGLRNIPVPPAPPLGATPQPAVGQNTGEFSFLAPLSVAGRAPGCGEEGER